MADPQARHVVEAMLVTALADGKVQGEEALAIKKILASEPMLVGLGDVAAIGKEIHERVGRLGLEETVREIAAGITDREHRELCFRCCAKVMGADSQIEMEEATVLYELQEAFGLSGDDVKRLLSAAR